MFSSHLALSLPSVVTFSDGSTITYLYTADGRKLRTTHVINGTTTTTDYCGNVIYEGTAPKKLLTDEGYVDLTGNTYYYYLKDHQGNNRVVINATEGGCGRGKSLLSVRQSVLHKYQCAALQVQRQGVRHQEGLELVWHTN